MSLLTLAAIALGLGVGSVIAAVVKTVRFHGAGKQTWAPPAVPFFIAGMVFLAGALILGFAWALLGEDWPALT